MSSHDVEDLEQLVYVSSATYLFSDEELVEMLDEYRTNHELLDVSGMLVYAEGTFIHALEGHPHILTHLYDTIQRDGRFRHCFQLLRQPIEQRAFEGWSMGFRPCFGIDVDNLVGYVDFFGDRPVPERGAPAYRLLSSFRKQHDRELVYSLV